MIESLSYESLEEWDYSYKIEVSEEAAKLNDEFDWWSEPVILFDQIEKELFLTGSSSFTAPSGEQSDIFGIIEDTIPIIPIEVDPRDMVLLRIHNLENVLKILSKLSKDHEFTWELKTPIGMGEDMILGYITNGEKDETLKSSLNQLTTNFRIDPVKLHDETFMKSLILKYHENLEKAQQTGW